MYDHVRYALHALESGADGFVVKGSPFQELVQAVRDVHRGQTYISTSMAPKLADRLRKKDKKDVSLDALSQREFEVFTLLSSGLSVKEAASQIGISEKTVTTYRARLMEKMNLSNKADLIRVALESGLLE
jgi:DNA-binding NarL/FixJ family response regulator